MAEVTIIIDKGMPLRCVASGVAVLFDRVDQMRCQDRLAGPRYAVDPNKTALTIKPRSPFIRAEHPIPSPHFVLLASPVMQSRWVSSLEPTVYLSSLGRLSSGWVSMCCVIWAKWCRFAVIPVRILWSSLVLLLISWISRLISVVSPSFEV